MCWCQNHIGHTPCIFHFRHLPLTASLNCFSSPYLQADSVKRNICGDKYFKQPPFFSAFIHLKAAIMVSVQYAEVEKGRSTHLGAASRFESFIDELFVSSPRIYWFCMRGTGGKRSTTKRKEWLSTVEKELLSSITNKPNFLKRKSHRFTSYIKSKQFNVFEAQPTTPLCVYITHILWYCINIKMKMETSMKHQMCKVGDQIFRGSKGPYIYMCTYCTCRIKRGPKYKQCNTWMKVQGAEMVTVLGKSCRFRCPPWDLTTEEIWFVVINKKQIMFLFVSILPWITSQLQVCKSRMSCSSLR